MSKNNPATKQTRLRRVALLLAVIMLGEAIFPASAFALTGGPSQPEVESFEPVTTTEMVNLFSGDFNYNIPLMTVPGPNGGYPINLAYHAGIGMEQEASWVGLGWNINPGVINRNMRGLPDDFNGDEITKTLVYKPQTRWAFDYSPFLINPAGVVYQSRTYSDFFNPNDENTRYNTEVFGFDTKKATFSYHVHYDNYKGVGVGISMNITSSNSKKSSPRFSPSLSLSFDTDGGIGITPSVSYNKYSDDQVKSHTVGLGFNSRQGLQSFRYNSSISKVKSVTKTEAPVYNYVTEDGKSAMNKLEEKYTASHFQSKPGSGFSFAFNASLPNFQQRVSSISYQTGFTYGQLDDSSIKHAKYKKRRFSLGYTAVTSEELDIKYKAFGFNNYQNYQNDKDNYMTDFYREKNTPATKNTPSISMGVSGYDSYLVSGQGMSGAFRSFRSNVIVLSDAKVKNLTVTAALQPEWGDNLPKKISLPPPANLAMEFGGDYGVGFSSSYSGDWNTVLDNGLSEISTLTNLLLSTYPDPLYQYNYYKSTGEMSASPVAELDYIRGTRPMRFGLDQVLTTGEGILSKVVDKLIENENDPNPISLSGNNIRTTRQKQIQLLTTRTAGQLTNTNGYGRSVISVYTALANTNPNNFPSTAGLPNPHTYSNYPAHHTAEVTVTNPDGNRYVYGLPVYNKSQKEVMFSRSGIAENNFDKTADYYVGVDNSAANNQGFENLYMSTEIPQYAYSYMLTAIYSPDYVDLTGDGPTDDDFGYWVKFNYTKVHDNYGWRIPYKDANYNKGQISNEEDDKLSYTYGTKEIYYLNSVQTKTHEARFILNTNQGSEDRTDANGAAAENFMTSTPVGTANQLHYLKAIELVSKKDPNRIIKKAVFEYDYSLCKGILNTSDANNGKLTLKKLYFIHQGNNKGALSPYQFTYGYNPNYNQDYMDRWGYYQPDQTSASVDIYSKENPYNNQADNSTAIAANNQNASAWNLSAIQLPSGGSINIEYEADDYGYVQGERAMQMQQICGFGEYTYVNADGSAAYHAVNNKLHDRNTIVFFKLDKSIPTSIGAAAIKDSIRQYVENIDQIYFKAFMKLKKQRQGANTGQDAYDYVQGYAQVDKSQANWYGFGINNQNTNSVTEGWVRIKNEERNPWNPIGQTDHPFKLAGWQYMRLERNDLFDNGNLITPNPSIQNVISSMILLGQDFTRLFGYYRFCQMFGFCNELYLESDITKPIGAQPSYIRLNSPNKYKVGGGHRVKKLTISDNWQQISGDVKAQSESYSVEYSYINADGSTSGVAEYEPIIGGEEIPQHKPLRYNQRKYNYKDDGLYTEEPFGESLYPAPSVGYSRVIVKNGDRQNVTANRSGIAVTEFYTAKDFPIFSTHTDLKKKGFAIPVIVHMFMEVGYNNKGYSQGFSVELNNMHGQLKSKAVYAANTDINSPDVQPVSKEEYIYKTETPYAPDRANKLYNRVTVLDADGVYREADLGLTHDFTIDRQQHSNYSVGAGIETNMGAVPPYTFWGNVFPKVEISASMYRSISTLKVIQRNGVLDEVRSYKDGAYAVSRNLMYDAETGQPLLTQTINNFDKPVYSYSYAAHWAYPALGGAYKNIGANFYNATVSAGVYAIANPSKYFTVGDEIQAFVANAANYPIYWVSAVDDVNGTVTLIDEANTSNITLSGATLTIIRSGYRNQQSVTNGSIVSLSNPVTERRMPLFDAFNAFNASNPPQGSPSLTGTMGVFNDFYVDCVTGEAKDVKITWQPPYTLQFQNLNNGECIATVVFEPGHGITNLLTAFAYDLQLSGSTRVYATRPNVLIKGYWSNPDPLCFGTCIDNVLHADASSFSEDWSFNYADAGDPQYRTGTSPLDYLSAPLTPLNPWRFGTKGIWRGEQSWAYQVDRKQSSDPSSITNIAIDGTYKHFVPFNWAGSNTTLAGINPQWTLGTTITRYSPHGFELENKDAIGNYSSALYGYEQSLATAVAGNAQYLEMGFDGFEDYSAPSVYGGTAHGYGHGHFEFLSVNPTHPIALTTSTAHTGKYSLNVSSMGAALMQFNTGAPQLNSTLFTAEAGKKYNLSLWVKTSSSLVTPSVVIEDAATSSVIVSASPDPKQSAIEGWRRIEVSFTALASGNMNIRLQCSSPTGGAAWFDDIRIQPFVSGMKTYVYDPLTLWVVAELDDRNYATFYNYDEEGALVQVKKETEKGIVTLRTSRGNINR
jgi:hypothetical protein